MTNKQFELLKSIVKPGDFIFIAGDTFISELISYGESLRDHSWTNRVTHVGWVDKDYKIHESAITMKIVNRKLQYASGIMIRPMEEWKNNDKLVYLFVMRLDGMTDEKILQMMIKSESLKAQNRQYPLEEVLGVLVGAINSKFLNLFKWMNPKFIEQCQTDLLMKKNPFDNPHNFFCVSFANHLAEFVNLRLISKKVEESQCVLGDALRNIERAYTLFFVCPSEVDNYYKPAGKEFDLVVAKK